MKKKEPLFKISGKLDLHGMIVQDGFNATKEFLENCRYAQQKYVSVVTGQSGQMRKEFPDWMNTLGYGIVQTNIGNFIVKTF